MLKKEFEQKYTDDSTYNWECHLGWVHGRPR